MKAKDLKKMIEHFADDDEIRIFTSKNEPYLDIQDYILLHDFGGVKWIGLQAVPVRMNLKVNEEKHFI